MDVTPYDRADAIRAGNLVRALRDGDIETWMATMDALDGASAYRTLCAVVSIAAVLAQSVVDLADEPFDTVLARHVSAVASLVDDDD